MDRLTGIKLSLEVVESGSFVAGAQRIEPATRTRSSDPSDEAPSLSWSRPSLSSGRDCGIGRFGVVA